MVNYDALIKAEKMGYFSDYETMLFARAKGKIKSVTGVLPLTFTAKGGTAADWTIYGNDENGTEQLLNCATFETGHLNSDGTIDSTSGVTSVVGGNGSVELTLSVAWRGAHCDYIDVSEFEQLYLSYSGANSNNQWRFCFYDATQTFVSCDTKSGMNAFRLTVPNSAKYLRIGVQLSSAIAYTFTNVSLIAGSTAPDHYIPYQQGVGERTAQLFPDTVGKQVITVAAGTNLSAAISGSMTLAAGRYTIHYYQSTLMTSNTRNTLSFLIVGTSTQIYESAATNHNLDAGWYSWTFDIPNDGSYQMRIWIVDASDEVKATNFILTKGETATPTEYIPYGYQIPLTISQTGQTNKNYDIYIGDSPLTEGETVSKTSTGVDIELFEGESTVSTTLYNKPEMKIEYD